MPKKAVLRTAQDIFALDKAFFLIEGHPLNGLAVEVFPRARLLVYFEGGVAWGLSFRA